MKLTFWKAVVVMEDNSARSGRVDWETGYLLRPPLERVGLKDVADELEKREKLAGS